MQKSLFVLAICAISGLSGCMYNDTERAAAGAVGGAVLSGALGGNVLLGAAVGGAAGALCDDARVCN